MKYLGIERRSRFGLVAVVTISLGAAGASQVLSGDTKYVYDALGRVTEACYPDNSRVTYQYDAAGNRTQVTRAATGTGVCSGSSSSSSSSTGGGGNIAPVCTNLTITMGGIPTSVPPVTVTPAAATMLGRCTDANGHTMTLVTPTMPYSFTIAAGQTVNVPFTVSDGNGGTGGATLTYFRPTT